MERWPFKGPLGKVSGTKVENVGLLSELQGNHLLIVRHPDQDRLFATTLLGSAW